MNIVLFLVLLSVLLILPFVPALVEMRRKTDAAPLRVVRDYDVDVRFFARTFAAYIEQHFRQALKEFDALDQIQEGTLDDGSVYRLLKSGDAVSFDDAETRSQITTRMIISRVDLNLPGAMSYLNELYAGGTISGADEDIYRALLAGKDIVLGRDSMLLRWMHAAGAIQVAEGCVLHGRVSADKFIQLAPRTRFERLNAPEIRFGNTLPAASTIVEHRELQPDELPVSVEVGAGRWLIEDDVLIPEHSRVDANLVVVGNLVLGEHCEINGSIKSRKPLHIRAGCTINGSVVCGDRIDIDADTTLRGPLVSEAQINIARHCRFGTLAQGTTITAEHIRIHADCVAHGTVWARRSGEII